MVAWDSELMMENSPAAVSYLPSTPAAARNFNILYDVNPRKECDKERMRSRQAVFVFGTPIGVQGLRAVAG